MHRQSVRAEEFEPEEVYTIRFDTRVPRRSYPVFGPAVDWLPFSV